MKILKADLFYDFSSFRVNLDHAVEVENVGPDVAIDPFKLIELVLFHAVFGHHVVVDLLKCISINLGYIS